MSCRSLETIIDNANNAFKDNLSGHLDELKQKHNIHLSADENNYSFLTPTEISTVNEFFNTKTLGVYNIEDENQGFAGELFYLEYDQSDESSGLNRVIFNPQFGEMVKAHILEKSKGNTGYMEAESRATLETILKAEFDGDKRGTLYSGIQRLMVQIRHILNEASAKSAGGFKAGTIFSSMQDSFNLMLEALNDPDEFKKFSESVSVYTGYIINAVETLKGVENEIRSIYNRLPRDEDGNIANTSEIDFLRIQELNDLSDSYNILFSDLLELSTLSTENKDSNKFVELRSKGLDLIGQIDSMYLDIAGSYLGEELFKVNNDELRTTHRNYYLKKSAEIQKEINSIGRADTTSKKNRLKVLEERKATFDEYAEKLELSPNLIKAILKGEFGDIQGLFKDFVSHALSGDVIIQSIGTYYRNMVNRINRKIIPVYNEFGKVIGEYMKSNPGLHMPQDWYRKFVVFSPNKDGKMRLGRDSWYYDYTTKTVKSRRVIEYLNPFPPKYTTELELYDSNILAEQDRWANATTSEERAVHTENLTEFRKKKRNLQREYGTLKYTSSYYEGQDRYEEDKLKLLDRAKKWFEDGTVSEDIDLFKEYESISRSITLERTLTVKKGKFDVLSKESREKISQLEIKQSDLRNVDYHYAMEEKDIQEYKLSTVLNTEYEDKKSKAEDKNLSAEEKKIAEEEFNKIKDKNVVTEGDRKAYIRKRKAETVLKEAMASAILEMQTKKRDKVEHVLKHKSADGTIHDGEKEWRDDMKALEKMKDNGEINEDEYQQILTSITSFAYDDEFSKKISLLWDQRLSAEKNMISILKAKGVLNDKEIITDLEIVETLENKGHSLMLKRLQYETRRLMVRPFRDEDRNIRADVIPPDIQEKIKEIDEELVSEDSGIGKIIYNSMVYYEGDRMTLSDAYNQIEQDNADINDIIAEKQHYLNIVTNSLGIKEYWDEYREINKKQNQISSREETRLYQETYTKELLEYASKYSDYSIILDESGKTAYVKHNNRWYAMPRNLYGTTSTSTNDTNALSNIESYIANGQASEITDFESFKEAMEYYIDEDFKSAEGGWYERNHYYNHMVGRYVPTYIWYNIEPKDPRVRANRKKKRGPAYTYRKTVVREEFLNKNGYDNLAQSHLPDRNKQNNAYYALMSNKSDAKLLSFLTRKHQEASNNFPEGQRLKYRIPYNDKRLNFSSFSWKDKSWINPEDSELAGAKVGRGALTLVGRSMYLTDQDMNEGLGFQTVKSSAAGVGKNTIPHYLSTHIEPEFVDLDLGAAAFRYLTASIERDEMTKNFSPVTNAMVKVMEKNTPKEVDKVDGVALRVSSRLGQTIGKKLGLVKDHGVKQEGGLNRRLETFLTLRNMWEFGVHIDPNSDKRVKFLGKDWSITKLASKLRAAKSISVLGSLFPFFGASYSIAKEIPNVMNSLAMATINGANENQISSFTLKTWFHSAWMYFTEFMGELGRDWWGARIQDKSYIGKLMDYFNVLDGKMVDEFGKIITDKSKLQLALNGDFFFLVKNGAEMFNYVVTFTAFMKDTKVLIDGKEYSLFDAYHQSSGEIKLKKGNIKLLIKNPEFPNDPSKRLRINYSEDLIMNNIQRLLEITQGNYSKTNKTVAQMNWFGQGLLWMKKFMPPFLVQMYGNAAKDVSEQNIRKGYLRSTFTIMLTKLMNWRSFKIMDGTSLGGDLTPTEAAHLKMTFTHAAMYFSIAYIFVPIILGYDDDDDERFEKMRDRRDTVPGGEIINWVLFSALKTQGEIGSLVPIVAPREFTKSITSAHEGIFPFMTTVEGLLKDLDPESLYTTRDKFGYEKGSFKAFIRALHLLPGYRASRADATETIKSWEWIRNK